MNDPNEGSRLADFLELAIEQLGSLRPSPLTREQQRVDLEFRALREAIGGAGRRGEAHEHALMTSPVVTLEDEVLTFVDPLPLATKHIILRYPGRDSDRAVAEMRNDFQLPGIDDAERLIGVELADGRGNLLLMGLPEIRSGRAPSPRRTVASAAPDKLPDGAAAMASKKPGK